MLSPLIGHMCRRREKQKSINMEAYLVACLSELFKFMASCQGYHSQHTRGDYLEDYVTLR